MINIFKEINNHFEVAIENERIENYTNLVVLMTDEQLGYELSDRVGNELKEFELIMAIKGRDGVIERLVNNFIERGI